MSNSKNLQNPKANQSPSEDKKLATQPEVEKNNSNTTQTEEDKDPTKYGDWQVNGRAIDF